MWDTQRGTLTEWGAVRILNIGINLNVGFRMRWNAAHSL